LGRGRDWLKTGSIPAISTGENITLLDELIGPTFALTKSEAIQLESKKEMRSRGIPSPNVADALACTFAYPSFEYVPAAGDKDAMKAKVLPDYDPFDRSTIYDGVE
jgi:hypothetical protein